MVSLSEDPMVSLSTLLWTILISLVREDRVGLTYSVPVVSLAVSESQVGMEELLKASKQEIQKDNSITIHVSAALKKS